MNIIIECDGSECMAVMARLPMGKAIGLSVRNGTRIFSIPTKCKQVNDKVLEGYRMKFKGLFTAIRMA